jgi:hypothetical protein
MEAMGLNKDIFWEKFDAKFEEDFKKTDEDLKSKYKIGQEGETAEKRKNYRKISRLKKLSMRSRYGNLKKAITSYSIKNLSRSSENPRSKYLVLEAKIDRNYLSGIYRGFVSGQSLDKFEKIYITLKLNLKNGDWKKLGVNYSSDLQEAVINHWKIWFQDKLGFSAEQIIVTDDALEEELKDKSTSASSILNPLALFQDSEKSSSSIWIRVNYFFKIINDNPLLRERKIEINSDFLAYKVGSSIPLHFEDFPVLRMLYSYSSLEQLSSDIASKVYELPLQEFSTVKSKMKTAPVGMKNQDLVISNSKSMTEIIDFMEVLKEELIRFSPVVQFDSFSSEQAKILIQYNGKPEDLKSQFLQLSNKVLKGGKKIQFVSQENPFNIIIKENVSDNSTEG